MRNKTVLPTPPGASIKEQLDFWGMTQKAFALRMDMPEQQISELMNGKAALTRDIALRLESVLGVPASFWLSLEAIYREKLKA